MLDCREGRVTAVLNGLLTGPSIPFLPPESSVIPTPWGSPTNTAVPATMLESMGGETLSGQFEDVGWAARFAAQPSTP